MGGKVRCISDRIYRGLPGTFGEPNHTCKHLTVGKVYDKIRCIPDPNPDNYPQSIEIKNDRGVAIQYPDYIFEEVE